MNTQELVDTAIALIAGDKGPLAMDESNPTCNKRRHFSLSGVIASAESRQEHAASTTTSGSASRGRHDGTRHDPAERACEQQLLDYDDRLPYRQA